MEQKKSLKSKLIKIAVGELVKGRWNKLNIKSLSIKSKVKIDDIMSIATNKNDLLDIWSHDINLKIINLVSLNELNEVSKKDRILELMLCRLDVLSVHKREISALISLARENTIESVRAFKRIKKAMQYILNISGIEATGKTGIMKIKILSLIWIITLKEWENLDKFDNSSLMSRLDKRLTFFDKLNDALFN